LSEFFVLDWIHEREPKRVSNRVEGRFDLGLSTRKSKRADGDNEGTEKKSNDEVLGQIVIAERVKGIEGNHGGDQKEADGVNC
jgi:hypothetical protein